MKKSKGLLTPAEKQVAQRNKKILILCVVLVLSLVINVIYIFDFKISIPKIRDVKANENETVTRDITVSEESEVAQSNTSTAKDRALEKAFNEAKIITLKEGSVFRIDVYSKNKRYNVELQSDAVYFSTYGLDSVSCSFVNEKFDGLLDILNEAELRELTIKSYPNEDGKLIDYNPEDYLMIYSDSGFYKVYPPENWDSIIEYCEELERIAAE